MHAVTKEVVQALLGAGVDANAVDKRRQHRSDVRRSDCNPEVVEALLAAGTTPLINTWTID